MRNMFTESRRAVPARFHALQRTLTTDGGHHVIELCDGKNRQERQKEWNVALKHGWAIGPGGRA